MAAELSPSRASNPLASTNAVAGPSRSRSPSGEPVALESSALTPGPTRDLDLEIPRDAVVTYRHVLSPQTLNSPTNPLRVVSHIDVDAAYAQFEGVRLGLDKSVPIAVQQWAGLIAVNYPAREFGITRHMNYEEARKRCPHLIAVHVATLKDGEDAPRYHDEPDMNTHKVSLEHYRKESVKIIRVFKDLCPTGEVEKASIDEAFLDLSAPVRTILLSRYPELADSPPLDLDSPLPPAPLIDWDAKSWAILSSSDAGGWADVALAIGAEIMEEVRQAVEDQLGYTTSAGISHNKMLSKLCSAHKKPRAQTVLRTSAVAGFLRPMRFQKIRLLGGKLGETIAQRYGASTVGDLLPVTLDEMQREFGEESLWVHNILRGIDQTEVKSKSLVKSMLASKNMRPAITTLEMGQSWIRVLCVELVGRLKEAREGDDGVEDEGGVWPKTLVLSWREVSSGGASTSKSKQVPFPFHRPLLSDGLILKLSTRLLTEALAPNARPTKVAHMKIINLALSFTGLERPEEGQRGIEGFLRAGLPLQSGKESSKGKEKAIGPPQGIKRFFAPAPASSSSFGSAAASSSSSTRKPSTSTVSPRKRKARSPDPDVDEIQIVGSSSPAAASTSFRCSRCKKAIPISSVSSKAEHDDWHFARDLQDEPAAAAPSSSSSRASSSSSSTAVGGTRKPPTGKKRKSDDHGDGAGAGGLAGWLTRKKKS